MQAALNVDSAKKESKTSTYANKLNINMDFAKKEPITPTSAKKIYDVNVDSTKKRIQNSYFCKKKLV